MNNSGERAMLLLFQDGRPFLMFMDRQGKRGAQLCLKDNGSPTLDLVDETRGRGIKDF